MIFREYLSNLLKLTIFILQWGDAPIHSLAAGALLSTKQVHYFRDYGYRHTTIQHCPANAPARQLPHIP